MEIHIITGPPYCGKGTQCEILKNLFGYMHVSTGERCRLEKDNKTEIGNIMSHYEAQGDLVPDAIMKKLFSQIIDENAGEKGIILDGYPRTKPQVVDLLELVASKNLSIGKVINIEVPKEELLRRAKKRAEHSAREDDKNEAVHIKRINVFEEMTRPAIAYMKTRLNVWSFDGNGTVEEVTEKIKAVL
ncbi:MAG TPA: nucleoside monophosphate kinase [Flavobacteriales bacterium]|nr:nucleoside monophosphate kinase [Flavobacteriales bacterium]